MTHKYKRLFTLAQISIIVFFRFIPQVKALTINGVFKGAGESVDTPIGQIPLVDLSSTQVPENSSILSLSLMGGMIIGSKWLRFFNNKINTKKNHGKNNR